MNNIPDYYIDNEGVHSINKENDKNGENSSSRRAAAANTIKIDIRCPLMADTYTQSMDKIYLAILSNNM